MARNIALEGSKRAQALESHWSLGTMVRDNWPWIAAVTGLPGFAGWSAWIKQTAENAPWYDKTLFVISAVLGTAFLVLGLQAFWIWARRSRREEGAIARGLSISGYTYERGAVVHGGTHSLAEIFGSDQLRTELLFRNCQIKGPGIVAFFACHMEKSDFFGLPGPHIIDAHHSGELARFAYQFMRCRFENCAFNDAVLIANLPMRGPDIYRYRLARMEDAEQ